MLLLSKVMQRGLLKTGARLPGASTRVSPCIRRLVGSLPSRNAPSWIAHRPSLAPAAAHAISTTALAPEAQEVAVMGSRLAWPSRTHGCGSITDSDADASTEVTLCGWVDRARNLGGILFLDVRDHTGVVQVVVDPQSQPGVALKAERLRSEWVVAITGTVRRRKDPNPKLRTGAIEIAAEDVTVLNVVSRPLPFFVSQSDEAEEAPREELRLKNRVLDLRCAFQAEPAQVPSLGTLGVCCSPTHPRPKTNIQFDPSLQIILSLSASLADFFRFLALVQAASHGR